MSDVVDQARLSVYSFEMLYDISSAFSPSEIWKFGRTLFEGIERLILGQRFPQLICRTVHQEGGREQGKEEGGEGEGELGWRSRRSRHSEMMEKLPCTKCFVKTLFRMLEETTCNAILRQLLLYTYSKNA